jgi:hypothetical protein
MDLDVSRVTSYAHAAELVARTLACSARGNAEQPTSIPKNHGCPNPLGLESQHGTRAAAFEPLAAQRGPDAHAADAADEI